MSYNTAVCFTSSKNFEHVAKSFCDVMDLIVEGTVNQSTSLARYVNELEPMAVMVDGWNNWHFILNAFAELCQDHVPDSLPQVYLFENKDLSLQVYNVGDNLLQFLMTGHCGLCHKAESSNKTSDSKAKQEGIVRCFSCGALDDGKGDIIAFMSLPSIHPKYPDINLCSDCLERVWGSYQRVLKRATLELIHGSNKKREDR